jgi:hypothetical protein
MIDDVAEVGVEADTARMVMPPGQARQAAANTVADA